MHWCMQSMYTISAKLHFCYNLMCAERGEMLTYKQKHELANREARATVVALVITVVVWVVCGFGLAGLDVQVFHTPLWVLGGTLGSWACAIVVSVVLAKRVFVNFNLDDEMEAELTVEAVASQPEQSSSPQGGSDE